MGVCHALALSALLAPPPAHAAELSWSAPEGCPERAEIEEKIERVVGRPLAEVGRLNIDVTLSGGGERWSMRMRTQLHGQPHGDGAGERTIEGTSCAEVSEAAAVAVAMAVLEHAEAVPDPVTRSPEQPAPPPPAAEPVAATSEPSTENAEPGTPLRFGLGVGAAVDGGALPLPALGAALELFAGYGRLRAILLGTLFASQTTEIADGVAAAEFELALGALLLCGEGTPSPLRLLGCGGFELGELSGEGLLEGGRSGASDWRALRAEVALGFDLGDGFTLMGRAGAVVPLVRRLFFVNDGERLHRAGRVTARATLGLELHL